MLNWKAEIARIAYWKQVAAENDRDKALPWHLPRVGASRELISRAERALGIQFPGDYVEFLAHANGWAAFHVLTDLFSIDELVSRKRQSLSGELTGFLRTHGVVDGAFAVIGGSDADLDVFVLFSEASAFLPCGVLWFAADEVERYKSFSDFFSAMANYNAVIAQQLLDESRKR